MGQHALSYIYIGKSKHDNAHNNAGNSDTYCTCIGHLGQRDTDRIIST